MSYTSDENSIDNGQPIELYLFSYDNTFYEFTSSQYSQIKYIAGLRHEFKAEYISRSDTLKLGTSSGGEENCIITVPRSNNIALLYQGAPPEQGSVHVEVYRVHGEDSSDIVRIINGTVSQVKFDGSEANLSITIENVLSRNIPKGSLSYYCQNCIYDTKCSLHLDDWGVKCYIDEGIEGLTIYSANLREKPSGYFTDGFIKMGNCYRQIKIHQYNSIILKYNINPADKQGSFIAYPGCSNMFSYCATRFKNTDNFSGIPYIEPYDIYKHRSVGAQAYWVNGNIVVRDSGGRIS